MSDPSSESKHLNIVCFDVPFPADYGGAMEEFYKLKALYHLGVKIHLHCFVYGDRSEQQELEKYCEEVFYYPRQHSLKDVFSSTPFIVQSRKKDALLLNLLKNNYPILFDATHSTGFLDHPSLKHRRKVVRLHNIEWIYYNTLFRSSYALKEKLFYYAEYKKLRVYDSILEYADGLSCLSQTDFEYYKEKFPEKDIQLAFVFHENTEVQSSVGKGDYLLYHGNLSVLDNYMAVIELLGKQLKNSRSQIILAGKQPNTFLLDFIKDKPNISVIANPTEEVMKELIQNAQICLAIARNPSGIKLKLIDAIYRGRFIFSNENAFIGSGLEECVIDIDQCEDDMADRINEYMNKSFDIEHIERRKQLIAERYDNVKNAQLLLNMLFKH